MREMKFSMRKAGTALLSAFFVLPSLAQSPGNVTLELNKVSLVQALQQLKSQTQVRFVYSDEELRTAPLVTLSVDDASLAATLDLLFRDQPYTYEKSGENVYVIKPLKPAENQRGGVNKTIRGKVVDSRTGIPLIGATVQDPHSKRGTITAADGTFSVNVPSDCRHLSISFMGYEGERVSVVGKNTVVVSLEESAQSLDDVVVIGYGTANRKDFTGSISTINTDELRTIPALSVDDALAGKAAGVSVIKSDGSPGGAVRIRVRGGASLSGSTDPLYIIDGIPTEVTDNYLTSTEMVNPMEAANYGDDFNSSISGAFGRGLNNLAGLNIADIESISILKDASATAIYGSKAANGVVIITTKRGQRDTKPQVNLNYYISVSNPIKEKVLDAAGYKRALTEAAQRSINNVEANRAEIEASGDSYGISSISRILENSQKVIDDVQAMGDYDTDWLDLVLRTGIAHNVDFSVSGGGKNNRYYTSLSYSKSDGTLIATDFERYSGKVSLDTDISSRFRMGTNINFGYTKNNITNGLYSQALSAPPTIRPYNDDGTYASMGELGTSYMGFQNPMAVASATNQAKTYMFKGTLSAEWDILKGDNNLVFRSTASVDYQNYNQLNYIPSYLKTGGFYGAEDSGNGTGTQAQSNMLGVFFENTLTYNRVFNDDHRFDALVGTSWEDRRTSFFSATGKGYPDDDFLNNLSSAQTPAQVQGANPSETNSLLSFYARFNYVFKDRYYLTFTGRADGSSKFAPDHRWGYFPSGAVAWLISEESFLKDVHWVDEIKLRASIGKTGTQDIADHMWRTLYNVGAYGGQSALYPAQLGNDEIKWESTVQKDLGLDFSFFKGRLGGTLAYYHKTTDGALLNITLAPSSGYSTVVYNIAKIRNVGWEFELHGDFIRNRDWTWSGSFNIAHNGSKVLSIAGDQYSNAADRNELNLGTAVVREGESLGLLCGYKAVGIIENEEQLAAFKEKFPSWTSFMQAIGVGSVELAIDDTGFYYQDVIGNCTPDFFGGYTNTLRYKNWSLLAMFTFSYGNELIYQKDVTDMAMNSLANRGVSIFDGSTSEHVNPNRPASFYQGDMAFLTNLNVYDASYLKLKTLSLQYAFPSKWLKKLHMSSASIYATATNLFTITKYPGPDPEVSDDPRSIIGGGRDISSYPTTRSYTFGVRVGF